MAERIWHNEVARPKDIPVPGDLLHELCMSAVLLRVGDHDEIVAEAFSRVAYEVMAEASMTEFLTAQESAWLLKRMRDMARGLVSRVEGLAEAFTDNLGMRPRPELLPYQEFCRLITGALLQLADIALREITKQRESFERSRNEIARLREEIATLNAVASEVPALQAVLEGTKARLKALEEQSQFDEKSQLMSTPAFMKALEQLRLEHPKIALAFGDFSGLKMLNDYLGHRIGDEAIRHVGELLRSTIRVDDLVTRMGGGADEFLIALSLERSEDLHGALMNLMRAFDARPMEIVIGPNGVNLDDALSYLQGWQDQRVGFNRAEIKDGVLRIYITIAFGADTLPEGQDVATVLKSTDQLMYIAKRSSKGIPLDADKQAEPQRPPRNAFYINGSKEPEIFEPGFSSKALQS